MSKGRITAETINAVRAARLPDPDGRCIRCIYHDTTYHCNYSGGVDGCISFGNDYTFDGTKIIWCTEEGTLVYRELETWPLAMLPLQRLTGERNMAKVTIEGTYDEMVTLSVELRNVADRYARDNLDLYNNENERLARKVKTLQDTAQKFEEATFAFPTPAEWGV